MPQPDEQQPADQTLVQPVRPSRQDPTPPVGTPAAAPDGEATTLQSAESVLAAGDEPATEATPVTEQAPDTGPPTAVVAPRWSGSAAVPAPTGRKRRRAFQDTETELSPAPPSNPTLELPAAERAALEASPPTDPWAGTDPWAPYGGGYPGVASGSTIPPDRVVAPPAANPPAPPAAPPRQAGRTEKNPPGYGYPPPPGWQPPPGYVLVVRRRRRWPWVMLILALLTFGCCCGVPIYIGKPVWDQYPASATPPAEIGDLRLRDDDASRQTAQRLEREMRAAHLIAEDTFASVYSTAAGKQVTIFGVTGLRWSPDKDIEAEIIRLTATYRLTGLRAIKTHTRGDYVTCGTGRADGTAVVACTWADHGSLGTALFTRLSIEDSVRLLRTLRTSIVTRD